MKEYTGPDRVISAAEMQLELDRAPASIVKVKSLLPSMDAAIGDFRDGELVVISGPTKNGKTLLAQTLTANFVLQQHFPLWFSYEVPARQFISQFTELPMIYLPAKLKANAMNWLEERMIESHIKYNTRIVFIDHLHYLVDMARIRNPSIEIGTVIRRLKSMAVENGFVIFLLCHTVKGKIESDLSFEAIRDSSFISQESDTVIMIRRTPADGENAAEMRIEFHRRTGVFKKLVKLVKTNGFLKEAAKQGA